MNDASGKEFPGQRRRDLIGEMLRDGRGRRTPSGMLAIDLGEPRGERALPLLRRDDLTGLQQLPWRLVKITGAGRRLMVSVSLDGGCRMKGVTVDETDATVDVAVYGRCGQGRASVLVRRHALAAVRLAAPLGQRQLTGQQHDPDVGNRLPHGFNPEA